MVDFILMAKPMIYNGYGRRGAALVVILIITSFFWNRKPKFVLPTALIPVTTRWLRRAVLPIFVLISCLLLFDLQIVSSRQILTQKKIPIQILFDVSLSMSAKDLKPNRFVAAKASLTELTKKLDGYPMSLIAFSGIPLVYIPYSTDTQAIQAKLEHMSLADFPPVSEFLGTAIGDALLLGIDTTRKQYATGGILILITDGDSNVGHDPQQAAAIAKLYHMPIFSLGIGRSSYLIGYDSSFMKVMTSMDMKLLEAISEQTDGDSKKIMSQADMDQFFDLLAKKIREQEHQSLQESYFSLNLIFLPLWILVLISGGVLQIYGRKRG